MTDDLQRERDDAAEMAHLILLLDAKTSKGPSSDDPEPVFCSGKRAATDGGTGYRALQPSRRTRTTAVPK